MVGCSFEGRATLSDHQLKLSFAVLTRMVSSCTALFSSGNENAYTPNRIQSSCVAMGGRLNLSGLQILFCKSEGVDMGAGPLTLGGFDGVIPSLSCRNGPASR